MLPNRPLCAHFTITMVQYNDLIGSLLIGSWLSMMLYGVVVCKIWEYLEWYPASGDARVRNGLLFCCTVTSSIAMVTQLMNVYYASPNQYTTPRDVTTTDAFDPQPTVTFWGEYSLNGFFLQLSDSPAFGQGKTGAIQREYWPVPVYIVANSLTGAMVHAFLIYRVYSRESYRSRSSSHSPLFWGETRRPPLHRFGLLVQRLQVDYPLSLPGVGLTFAPDILIAAALIWKLTTMKTSFKRTNSLIKRLVVGAVQTGSTTSTAAVATMVSYYILDESSNGALDFLIQFIQRLQSSDSLYPRTGGTVSTAIYYLIGPLYMLTLLYNLNLRQYRDRIDTNVSESTDIRLTGSDAMGMDGIHFHRTAIVSIDPPDEDASRSRVDVTVTKLSPDTEGGLSAPKGGCAGRADLESARWI
ncbi:hypothetical protein DFH08DRAFT_1054547 [Mycena albidolilacea]|uniref:DUF6534 domain-containing protein n=1 Tax=Mycena albidolilacea TaxID=1033008 RepID=A0AAD6Z3Z7_9AGAR|nr:hypothetical protein DFH08DRAFT_1054547 [Mycena albidolilacea]